MSWFQRFLLGFKRKWRSYAIALTLAASIAANIAVWKTYSVLAEKAGFSKTTAALVKKHTPLLEKTVADIDKIKGAVSFAKIYEQQADSLIAEGNVAAAKKKLAMAIKMLKGIPGDLEKLGFEELQAELAVIKARTEKDPELADLVAGIEENEARLREMIAWRAQLLESVGSDIKRVGERLSELG